MSLSRSQVSPAGLVQALSDWAESEALDPEQLTVYYWIEFHSDGSETREAPTLDELRRLPDFPPDARILVEFGSVGDRSHATIEIVTRSSSPDRADLTIMGRDKPRAAAVVAFLNDRFPAPPSIATPATASMPKGPTSKTELTAMLPLLRLRPAAARDLWRTLIDPGLGMRLESSGITITMQTREHKFDDIEAVLACDQLPDALFRPYMYAIFLPENVPYGLGDVVKVSFSAKPAVSVIGRSEVWAGGKLYALENAAKRLRSPYWWLRPWNSANLLVYVPWLLILALLYGALALTRQSASLVAILPLSVGLLLMFGVGLLDEFVFRLTQSRIRRSSPGAWTKSDIIGLLLVAVTVLSVLATAFGALVSAKH